ncbi:hypothetical protein D3C72_1779610 [compost metagenome]
MQQDRQRPHFLAGTAAGHPQLHRGVGAQHRHHLFAHLPEILRVTEHLRDLHGEELHGLGEQLRLVQQPMLQVRQALALVALHGLADATAQRGHRIAAEVVVVALVQRFQQDLQLQVEQRLLVHCREHQTRHSDTSLSTSMGLAM